MQVGNGGDISIITKLATYLYRKGSKIYSGLKARENQLNYNHRRLMVS